MIEITAGLHDRHCLIQGVGRFRVPAPSVTVGLVVTDLMRPEDAEDVDWDLVRDVCFDWLPLSTASTVFAADVFSVERRRTVLFTMCNVGFPERLTQMVEDSISEDAPRDHWHMQIARYRDRFGGTLEEVLNEPWLLFLSQLREVERIQAQEMMRFMRSYVATRSKTTDLADAIAKQATPDAAAPQRSAQEYHDPAPKNPDERSRYREKKRAEAALIRYKMNKN